MHSAPCLASAIGYRANAPIMMLPSAADKHVAATTAVNGMPVSARMDGFTKMMYAIVTKVVNPARISVRQSVPRASNSKYCSRRRFRRLLRAATMRCRVHVERRQVSSELDGHGVARGAVDLLRRGAILDEDLARFYG